MEEICHKLMVQQHTEFELPCLSNKTELYPQLSRQIPMDHNKQVKVYHMIPVL